jgi:hypothetical protein
MLVFAYRKTPKVIESGAARSRGEEAPYEKNVVGGKSP